MLHLKQITGIRFAGEGRADLVPSGCKMFCVVPVDGAGAPDLINSELPIDPTLQACKPFQNPLCGRNTCEELVLPLSVVIKHERSPNGRNSPPRLRYWK